MIDNANIRHGSGSWWKKLKTVCRGYPQKILKQKYPFGAFWCILVSYKNGSRRPKKWKSVKKLKTLMPAIYYVSQTKLVWREMKLPSISRGTSQYKDTVLYYQYRDSHYKDETVVRLSHLYNGNPYIQERWSLYWDLSHGILCDVPSTHLRCSWCVCSACHWPPTLHGDLQTEREEISHDTIKTSAAIILTIWDRRVSLFPG